MAGWLAESEFTVWNVWSSCLLDLTHFRWITTEVADSIGNLSRCEIVIIEPFFSVSVSIARRFSTQRLSFRDFRDCLQRFKQNLTLSRRNENAWYCAKTIGYRSFQTSQLYKYSITKTFSHDQSSN